MYNLASDSLLVLSRGLARDLLAHRLSPVLVTDFHLDSAVNPLNSHFAKLCLRCYTYIMLVTLEASKYTSRAMWCAEG